MVTLYFFLFSKKCIIFSNNNNKKIWQSLFTVQVTDLLAELRSRLWCATSTGMAPLGVPHLGLQHVSRGTWGCVFWFGFSGRRVWNLCYRSPPVRRSGGGFLTSLPFHNNIRLHTSILSCHIVGLISGNIVTKIKDSLLFRKVQIDLCHLNIETVV